MTRYRITETCEYEVEAESAEEAADIYLESADVNNDPAITFYGVNDLAVIES